MLSIMTVYFSVVRFNDLQVVRDFPCRAWAEYAVSLDGLRFVHVEHLKNHGW